MTKKLLGLAMVLGVAMSLQAPNPPVFSGLSREVESWGDRCQALLDQRPDLEPVEVVQEYDLCQWAKCDPVGLRVLFSAGTITLTEGELKALEDHFEFEQDYWDLETAFYDKLARQRDLRRARRKDRKRKLPEVICEQRFQSACLLLRYMR